MAKEKQKMTLNVRKRTTTVADVPPPIDPEKIEAFASGAEIVKTEKKVRESEVEKTIPIEPKVVRDAFTMPASDHDLFAEIQKRCVSLGIVVTKSEIVRAGLKFMAEIDERQLKDIVAAVPKLKTGRPIQIKK